MHIHLEIARTRRLVLELQDRVAEIRPGFPIAEARMKNPQALAVQGAQFIAAQPLMLPDGL